MTTKSLPVDLLRIDGDTQSRVEINEDVVSEYTELIEASGETWPFPDVDAFHDGTDYFVGDGFHRYLAAKRAKRDVIPCNVHTGTSRDARIFGMTANDHHGLRMTRADKRACVEWLLDNCEKITQKEDAEKAGDSYWLVKEVVASRKEETVRHQATPPKQEGEGCFNPDTPVSGDILSECSVSFAKGIRKQAFKATDDQIKFVAGLPTDAQEAIAREARFGKPMKAAIEKVTGRTPPKKRAASGGGKAEPPKEVSPAEQARFTVEAWATTISAMLSKPPSIDEYRAQWPGPKGDAVVKAATTLYEALKNWKKAIK